MKNPVPAKKKRLDVHGVLLLDKPAGISSNDALIRAKRIFNAKKAGHTGTLDPFATGLLPLCFGEATKFSQDLLDADKTYETVVHLGIRTTTGDTEGEIVERTDAVSFRTDEIEAVLSRFRGDIRQVPPMYSALKRDGKPLYEYARAGIELEREARAVTVHELTLLDYSAPCLALRVRCSKGTYIRALGEDIGQALGCGAHLKSLRRTRVGFLTLDSAVSLPALEEAGGKTAGGNPPSLEPVDYLLSSFPSLALNAVLAKRFLNGQRLSLAKENIGTAGMTGRCRVYAENGVFMGTAEIRPDGVLAPERLVALPDVFAS
ncbi:tRNA pseudouridine(55) synthase TruB [Oxalobacter paraformigenes]|uniref:tRNA pseudouridine synthase B n=1 Tax=Oxalobacter paraformigenes TaxID=556268 RepID=C3X4B6_9BURK|nr:tRNA pseudouridine(55) synthase TruB [Oxalobacter paraformigenes]EEO28052.1 tRNA pseudouridine synthase B [Oxalobacter paraformigenes]